MIQKRHVFYVEGYDPQGAEGYYDLFQCSWKRFLKNWPLNAKLSPLKIDSYFFAHWEIETSGPNWQVHTHYDFLRQEQFIRANMKESMFRQVPRALWWIIDSHLSGTMFRILRASRRFWFGHVYFQIMMLFWIAISIVGGLYVGFVLLKNCVTYSWASVIISMAVAISCFRLLRPLADRWFVVQINNCWPYLNEFARGKSSCFAPSINACAERLIKIARSNEVDEILIIGHSGGGVVAPAVVARALDLDPDVGKYGPKLVLMTLGSIMPGAGIHPKAKKLRAIIKQIAIEPSLLWIDVKSKKDIFNFKDLDPVAGIGIKVDSNLKLYNPLIWKIQYREMLGDPAYYKSRFNFFRMHYQFIMANRRRAPYDFFMLVCGPVTPSEWVKQHDLLAKFSENASYNGA